MSKLLERPCEGGAEYVFWCPGCECHHSFAVGTGEGPRWTFNGNMQRPTFSPSLLVATGHHRGGRGDGTCWCTYNEEHPDDPAPYSCSRCHLFLRDGMVRYLGDCTHDLAGEIIPLPDLDEPAAQDDTNA